MPVPGARDCALGHIGADHRDDIARTTHEFASRTVRVIALPGELDQLARVVGGPWTVEFLATIHVQAAFISGIGITLEAGLTSQRRAIGDVLKEVVARSPQTYILVDSTKFGRTALLAHRVALAGDGGHHRRRALAGACGGVRARRMLTSSSRARIMQRRIRRRHSTRGHRRDRNDHPRTWSDPTRVLSTVEVPRLCDEPV